MRKIEIVHLDIPAEEENLEPRIIAVLELLLAAGADVNHADQSGATALHISTVQKYSEVHQFLLSHGAQVSGGETVVSWSLL